jgi:hypothetical protein
MSFFEGVLYIFLRGTISFFEGHYVFFEGGTMSFFRGHYVFFFGGGTMSIMALEVRGVPLFRGQRIGFRYVI